MDIRSGAAQIDGNALLKQSFEDARRVEVEVRTLSVISFRRGREMLVVK